MSRSLILAGTPGNKVQRRRTAAEFVATALLCVGVVCATAAWGQSSSVPSKSGMAQSDGLKLGWLEISGQLVRARGGMGLVSRDYQVNRTFAIELYYAHASGKAVIASIYPKDAGGQFAYIETD